MARDRGLFKIITSDDDYPDNTNQAITIVNNIKIVSTILLMQL